ncbi:hypothetical protein [Jatrophihabitans sp.]|nr:hypothetical protein [Jatrophihabitans sp.]
MRPRLAAFWLAVAGVSILSPVVFNLASDQLGDRLPALRELNNYVTRRNG